MEQGNEIPVLHTNNGGAPRALVFAGRSVPLTPAQAKRARFVQHLNDNYRKLKETLEFIERFAEINQISPNRVENLKKASAEMLDELTSNYEAKIKAYEERMRKS
jgi:enoyl-CoA hydratase/carnithine racemase